MISNPSSGLSARNSLLRAFLECALGYYARSSEYPMIAAEALEAGMSSPALGELAALSRCAPEEQINDLVITVGTELGWAIPSRPDALRLLFSLWACGVGGEITAEEFALRSRITEARYFDSPANDWILPLVALDIELDERNRPKDVIERDIVLLAEEMCLSCQESRFR